MCMIAVIFSLVEIKTARARARTSQMEEGEVAEAADDEFTHSARNKHIVERLR